MGVTLERVQNKFACIIGELCSEPDILSQFAVWVDLRIAEYKAKGAISLDCSGTTPDPTWLKGLKPSKSVQSDPVLQGDGHLLTSRNARHKHRGISNSNSPCHVQVPDHHLLQRNRDLANRVHSMDRDYEVSVKDEPTDSDSIFPVSLHSNNGIGLMSTAHNNSSQERLSTGESSEANLGFFDSHVPRSRKRSLTNAEERSIVQSHSDKHIPSSPSTKSRRLSLASESNLSAGQDSSQSLLSVVGMGSGSAEPPSTTEEGHCRGHNSGRMSSTAEPNQTVAQRCDWRNGRETEADWVKGSYVDGERRDATDVEVVEIRDDDLVMVENVVSHREMMLRYAAEGRVPAVFAQGMDSAAGEQRVRWSSRMSLVKPRSTHKNTKCAVRTLRTWLTRYNDYREIETIPPPELDDYLVEFFSTIKRKNGSDYHPSSLNSLRKFLDFHLKENGYPHSITTSANFSKCQVAFRIKFIELTNLLSGKETSFAMDSSVSCESQTDASQAQEPSSDSQAIVDHQELDSGQDVHTQPGQQVLWSSDQTSEANNNAVL